MLDRRDFITTIMTASTVSIAGCSGTLNDSPEEIVEEFWEARVEGDIETQENLLHEESNVGSSEQPEVTIHEIEERSLEDFAEETGRSEEEIQDNGEEMLEETGGDDFAVVYFRTTDEYREKEEYYWLVYDDGWKIYNFTPDLDLSDVF